MRLAPCFRPGLLASLAASLLLAFAPAASAHRHHGRHHHGHRHAHRLARANGRCPGADTPAVAASKHSLRKAVLCLVDAQRVSRGLPALKESPKLDRSAQHWTSVMVGQGLFSHGSDFAARISAAGFRWGFAGENIATGFATPREVVNGWMGSPDHCRNILDPHYAYVGTGVSPHRLASFAPATWTQDFALPMGWRAPSNNTGPQNGCPH